MLDLDTTLGGRPVENGKGTGQALGVDIAQQDPVDGVRWVRRPVSQQMSGDPRSDRPGAEDGDAAHVRSGPSSGLQPPDWRSTGTPPADRSAAATAAGTESAAIARLISAMVASGPPGHGPSHPPHEDASVDHHSRILGIKRATGVWG